MKRDHEQIRSQVIALRKTNPCATLESIAVVVDRSRERVRQILDDEGLTTVAVKRERTQFECLNPECGQAFTPRYYRASENYCSPACRKAHNRLNLVCHACGVKFTRLIGRQMAQISRGNLTPQAHTFCSRKCSASFIGRNVGIHNLTYVPTPTSQCQRGHAWTEENTIPRPGGARACRACKNLRDRERRKEKNEAR